MPHTVEGFMKKSQKDKFVRNRDVKLKEKEIRTEEKIQKAMCEGVCPQCRDKAQWRFQYGKYKPLKKVAGCGGCRQKNVTKAYRTLCDKCASTRKVCAGCCADISHQHSQRKERNDFLGVDPNAVKVVDRTTAPALYTGKKEDDDEDDEDDEDEDDDEEMADSEEEDDDEEEMESNKKMKTAPMEEDVSAVSESSTFAVASWNGDRFDKIAATKYSKDRVVGAMEDNAGNVFDFADGKTATATATATVTEDDTEIMDKTLS